MRRICSYIKLVRPTRYPELYVCFYNASVPLLQINFRLTLHNLQKIVVLSHPQQNRVNLYVSLLYFPTTFYVIRHQCSRFMLTLAVHNNTTEVGGGKITPQTSNKTFRTYGFAFTLRKIIQLTRILSVHQFYPKVQYYREVAYIKLTTVTILSHTKGKSSTFWR